MIRGIGSLDGLSDEGIAALMVMYRAGTTVLVCPLAATLHVFWRSDPPPELQAMLERVAVELVEFCQRGAVERE